MKIYKAISIMALLIISSGAMAQNKKDKKLMDDAEKPKPHYWRQPPI